MKVTNQKSRLAHWRTALAEARAAATSKRKAGRKADARRTMKFVRRAMRRVEHFSIVLAKTNKKSAPRKARAKTTTPIQAQASA